MHHKAQEYLKSYHIRPSLHRLAVMDYLMQHKTHPSAEEIYSALLPSIPTLSRTTVYNTLSMLAEKGAIRVLDIDPAQAHYDGDASDHAHFICTRCGRIEDIFLDRTWFEALAGACTPRGAELAGVELSCKGICRTCNPKSNKSHKLLKTQ